MSTEKKAAAPKKAAPKKAAAQHVSTAVATRPNLDEMIEGVNGQIESILADKKTYGNTSREQASNHGFVAVLNQVQLGNVDTELKDRELTDYIKKSLGVK